MTTDTVGRVAIVVRDDPSVQAPATRQHDRLAPVFQALATAGLDPQMVRYADDRATEVYTRLLGFDGVLVWVDPISGGEDRTRLDALLRDVASRGVWVSAHPDVILHMGTKEVLYQTRHLGWGTPDTYRYRTVAEFREWFPRHLAAGGPRVLKQYRGNGGHGVWKVELLTAGSRSSPGEGGPTDSEPDALVRVQHAQPRDEVTEELRLAAFMQRCEAYFGAASGAGRLIDQPFQPRISEGMIRCYLVQDEVVGFARQYPPKWLPVNSGAAMDPDSRQAPPRNILGLPSAKTMFGPDEPAFQALRFNVESDWVPAMQRLLQVETATLPALWDADFLFGPKTALGEDTYVLCEINVSCVTPFPVQAPSKLARAVVACLQDPPIRLSAL